MNLRSLLRRLGLIGGLGAAYHLLSRSRMLRWGSTAEEAARVLPGDEVSPSTPFRSTMAITIDAPPDEIWPWLVQMGWGRGAFYSYNRIESFFRMDLHNADRVHPEWQEDLAVGDSIWMSHASLKAGLGRVQDVLDWGARCVLNQPAA